MSPVEDIDVLDDAIDSIDEDVSASDEDDAVGVFERRGRFNGDLPLVFVLVEVDLRRRPGTPEERDGEPSLCL